jgi:hypothetical protein
MIRKRAIVFGCMLPLVLFLARGSRASETCSPHDLKADELKERLKRWNGLAPLKHWQLKSISLDPCIREGVVECTVTLEAPANWSKRNVVYQASVPVRVGEASGLPLSIPSKLVQKVAGASSWIKELEDHEDVVGFLERYTPVRGSLRVLDPGEFLQVHFAGTFDSGRGQTEIAQLTCQENVLGRIVAYRVPRIDGLPVRREILRFVEVLSQRHPACFPSWVEGTLTSFSKRIEEDIFWSMEVTLTGEKCPPCFSVLIGSNGELVELEGDEK